MDTLVGRILSHYRILERVGAGGMGVVYRARDEHLDRDVALKVLPAGAFADEAARRQFRKEALALSKLNHPNIETVYDFDSAEGTDFLVMEYVTGESIRDRVTRGPVPDKDVIRLAMQLAQAMVAAHENGVVHRDLKPENLRVTEDGRLKVLDFGLAKLLHGDEGSTGTVTKTGPEPVTGTLPYMPPEQLLGQATDSRSDIYSTGAVLYEMATGQRPFAESHGSDLMAAILGRAPVPPHEVRRGLIPALEAIILKAMDKDPAHRYQSARELLVDLERVSTPTSVLVAARPPRSVRIRRFALAGAVLALAVVGGYAALHLLSGTGRRAMAPTSGEPSVAVLHFQNLGSSREDDSFAAGVTEDIITSLSRIEGLRILSRGAVERYRGKTVDPREVGKEIDVDYVLEGSIRRIGETLRVTAQLIQTSDGSHVWAQKFDGPLGEIFAVQDTVAARIASELRRVVPGAEQAALSPRWTQNPKAYAYYLTGREVYLGLEPGEDAAKVREWFERALALDPSYAPAMVGIADVIRWEWDVGRRDWDALQVAMKLARRAQALDSALARAFAAEGRVHGAMGFVKRAQGPMLRGLRANPRVAGTYAALAEIQLRLGKRDQAVATIRRGLEIDPYESQLYTTLAGAYRTWGQYPKAEETLAEGLSRLPRNPDLLVERATGLRMRRKFDEAHRVLRSVLEERPGRRMAHFQTMWALRGAGRHREADSAAGAVSQKWADPYALNEAGAVLLDGGRYAAAETLFRAIVRKEPNYYPSWRHLATSLRKQMRNKEAERVYQEILRRWPQMASGYEAVALGYFQMHQAKDAVRWALQATRLCPESEGAFFALGSAYQDLGRYEEAVGAFRKSIALRPDAYWSYGSLLSCLWSMGKFEAAAAAGESALVFKPDHVSALANLGGIYFEMGSLHRAASVLERALEIDSTKSYLYVNLGEVYRLEGQPQRALRMNLRAIELDSTMITAQYNVALISYSYMRDPGQVRRAIARIRQPRGAPKEFELTRDVAAAALRLLGRVEELEGRAAAARDHYAEGLREIQSVLRTNPNEPEHVETAAYLYGCSRDLRKTREFSDRLLKLQPGSPERLVNAACALSLAGDTGLALSNLEKAIAAGYRDKLRLSRDPDLDRVRADPRFKKAFASIE